MNQHLNQLHRYTLLYAKNKNLLPTGPRNLVHKGEVTVESLCILGHSTAMGVRPNEDLSDTPPCGLINKCSHKI